MSSADDHAAPLTGNVVVRAMTEGDLEFAYALSQSVHWPHRREDWQHAGQFGEGWVAECDGVVIGTALRWLWGKRHATLGLIIVSPQRQGQGVGHRLLAAVLDGIDARVVSLYATAAGRGSYERWGFRPAGRARQHQGLATVARLDMPTAVARLRPMNPSDAAALIALDSASRGMPRDALIDDLLTTGNTVVLERSAGVVGFATIRRFGRGMMIGPVIAPDLPGAQALIAHWVNLHVGQFIRIDTDPHVELAEWLTSFGLIEVDAPLAMRRGPPSSASDSTRAYALISQAFG